ncbi:hypothetical protein V5799_011788 [Amblyomma americanum]|uniref:Uncharacterized protein n=1 Tax=Amblyomma americanum TaxID=6943 RepID=A0AAQ4EG59_AMBAM
MTPPEARRHVSRTNYPEPHIRSASYPTFNSCQRKTSAYVPGASARKKPANNFKIRLFDGINKDFYCGALIPATAGVRQQVNCAIAIVGYNSSR